jgi:chorismate mutase
LEESIITGLIERAQYPLNPLLYEVKNGPAKRRSLFDLRLQKQERLDALFGRFLRPEERSFHRRVPRARYRVGPPATELFPPASRRVNLNAEIRQAYLALLPRLCDSSDSGEHERSLDEDVASLKAISRRVHFGAFYVAEAKLNAEPELYLPIIRSGDRQKLAQTIARTEVEEQVLKRIREKVERYQNPAASGVRRNVSSEEIVAFFRNTIIQLTKKGEVLYLMGRAYPGWAYPGRTSPENP